MPTHLKRTIGGTATSTTRSPFSTLTARRFSEVQWTLHRARDVHFSEWCRRVQGHRPPPLPQALNHRVRRHSVCIVVITVIISSQKDLSPPNTAGKQPAPEILHTDAPVYTTFTRKHNIENTGQFLCRRLWHHTSRGVNKRNQRVSRIGTPVHTPRTHENDTGPLRPPLWCIS